MAAKQKQRGLGRGLDVLFGDYKVDQMEENSSKTQDVDQKQEENTHEEVVEVATSPAAEDHEDIETTVILVDINSIKPNENQPRKSFNPEKIAELAESIKEHGIIQPLVLRKSKTGYELVAGERRWRAAREAGVKRIPAIVRELSDKENMLVAIIENMQRENLNPVEEAEGINQMIKTYGLTQEQVSKSLGKSRPYITNALRILTLPKEALDRLVEGKISAGHGRALLGIQGKEFQLEVLERIVREGLSVREVEKLAQGGKPTSRAPRGRRMEKSRDVIAVEQDLKDIFGTKVSIVSNGKKGAIEIEYYSVEELNRLIDLIKTIK